MKWIDHALDAIAEAQDAGLLQGDVLAVGNGDREPNKKLIIEMRNEISNEFHLDILKSGRLLQHPAIL